jgi:hypothetical protein
MTMIFEVAFIRQHVFRHVIVSPSPELCDHIAIERALDRGDESISCVCVGGHSLEQLLAGALGFVIYRVNIERRRCLPTEGSSGRKGYKDEKQLHGRCAHIIGECLNAGYKQVTKACVV